MLSAITLSKVYEDGTYALAGLDLEVKEGEIYCLLGANGAGKSTTMNLFLNFIAPTSGNALVDGIDVTREPLSAKRHLAYVPEQVMLYGYLTGWQTLRFFGKLANRFDLSTADYASAARKVGLDESMLHKRVRKLSKGTKQKLALAIALVKGANNLLLDEPTVGLDPKAAQEFITLLVDFKNEGKSILMCTHDLFRARAIADRIGILRAGHLIAEVKADQREALDLEKMYIHYMEHE